MERLINIELFLIIKSTQLNELITNLNLNLSVDSELYLATLVLVNIFAYLVMYLFVKLIFIIQKKIFRGMRRRY